MTRAVITLTPNLREAPTNNLSYTKGTVISPLIPRMMAMVSENPIIGPHPPQLSGR